MRTLVCLLFCLPFLFTSCEKDEVSPYTGEIVGTWRMESGSGGGQITTSFGGTEFKSDLTLLMVQPTTYEIQFTTAKQFNVSGSLNMEMTFDMLGQTTTQVVGMSDLFSDGTFEVTGDKMVLTANQGDNRQEVTIVTLTDTELQIEAKGAVTRTVAGASTVTDQVIDYRFVRVN
ncbi:lipocalin-like protein [Neolewinella xylanilytica]|uniref:Lipocalin-like protein n=1 Tax=Neolewinella xylanilytica TaxID=1514080 RepID=A0A2S6I3Y7_9BACT|nr:lipocalin family protein [Neolewinella xylanilytica]PPK85902.1 lipocalin-like protein [Neolewinella xylanilytica]